MTTTLLEVTRGKLIIYVNERSSDELAFRSAADVIEAGEKLLIIDSASCFEPARLSHSARFGNIDPIRIMHNLHVLRARSATDLEHIVTVELEAAMEQFQTRHVLIPNLLDCLYDPSISTRDASRALGRIKIRLEELAETGAQIVLLCRRNPQNLGTRTHFFSSLCAAADRVLLSQ